MSTPKLLTVQQVKGRLNCSRSQVYNLINSGDLKYLKLGVSKGLRITESDLNKFISYRQEVSGL